MQMHIAGLTLCGLGMVQAWQVTFWSGILCDRESESHTMTGTGSLRCGSPRGASLRFDAKSVSIDAREKCDFMFFTDNNSRCNYDAPAKPITVQGAFQGPGHACEDLDSRKAGKWKNLGVSCH